MSRKKIYTAIFCAMLGCAANASDRRELTEIIATCTGRMSAELEFAWLLSDPNADALEKKRSNFVDILDALRLDEAARRLLAIRIDAKMAHAELLTTAYFGFDVDRSKRAQKLALKFKNRCENLLLDS